MLIDIEFKQKLIDECNARLKNSSSPEDYAKYHVKSMDHFRYRIEKGVYQTTLNFHIYIELFSEMKIKDQYDSFNNVRRINGEIDWEHLSRCEAAGMESKQNYGVCDTYQQVLDKYPELQDEKRKFILSLCSIKRENQPERGGWRWEKWGTYIGTRNSQCQYLRDEPEIEEVFVYKIYEME